MTFQAVGVFHKNVSIGSVSETNFAFGLALQSRHSTNIYQHRKNTKLTAPKRRDKRLKERGKKG